ncbi:MAG TPA: FAD binding domain-containing protein, partial [Burkholderiales bacterium]|nr:FAD binding domain-containing protein [Burkholderiales bacterium]
MTPFELIEPRTLREAAAMLDTEDPAVRAIAGGTALMLMMKSGVFQPARLVSLRRVETVYAEIAAASDGGLRIGALTTLSALARSALVKSAAPVITQTLKTLSNVRVRNVA